MIVDSRKAAMWLGPSELQLKKTNIPEVIPGSILIKVHSCAICGSDLRIFREGNQRINAPQIIGHEVAGEIIDVGRGIEDFKEGDRVAIGADIPCNDCKYCNEGMANCCDTNYAVGYQFEGGFSEYMLLDPLLVNGGPIQKFDNSLSYDLAALAEPLACCLNGYERGLMGEGKTVVIFGAGPIGVMLAMLAKTFSAEKIIIIEPNQHRLTVSQEVLSGVIAINPLINDPIQSVMDETSGSGGDMVFTACPVVKTHEQALQLVAKRGVINFFGGVPKSSPNISLSSNLIHYREAYVTGSHGSTPKQHKAALNLIESATINVAPLITHRYRLDEINNAFETAQSGEALKVMVNPHA